MRTFAAGPSSGFAQKWRGAWMWSAKPMRRCWSRWRSSAARARWLAAMRAQAMFVDGMANLITAEIDRERLRQMLLALEAKQRLVELLTAYVDGRQQEVRVVVGLDETSPAMQDLVLIGAPARLGNANLGTVAVIAPTRIQYQEMIQAVRYISRLSERILSEPGAEVPAD
jgi:transcriptional regulator of heat shock response